VRILVPVIAFVFVLFRFSLRHYLLSLLLFSLSRRRFFLSLSLCVCVCPCFISDLRVSLLFVGHLGKIKVAAKKSTWWPLLLSIGRKTKNIKKEQKNATRIKSKKIFEKLSPLSLSPKKRNKKHACTRFASPFSSQKRFSPRARLYISFKLSFCCL